MSWTCKSLPHKYMQQHDAYSPGSLLRALVVGGLLLQATVSSLHSQSNPVASGSATLVPGFSTLPQPSAQSSGLSLDILGIPTGNNPISSPEPDINPNRSGPGIVLGFGQVVYDQTDLVIKGVDAVTDVVIARRHLSRRDQTNSIFGPAWAFNYSHTIQLNPDATAPTLTVQSFGRSDTFALRSGSTTVWEGTIGRYETVSYDGVANKYNMRMPHGTVLQFTADPVTKAGNLTQITSPNGNLLVFAYETAAIQADILKRKLLTITDSFGRVTTFAYTGQAQVQTITDFSGRVVTYVYNPAGQLTRVTSPAVTGDGPVIGDKKNAFPQGKSYVYQYPTPAVAGTWKNNLLAVIFPNQVADATMTPRFQWQYDFSSAVGGGAPGSNPYYGYVSSFTVGKPPQIGGTFAYVYQALATLPAGVILPLAKVNTALRQTTVTDRNGNKAKYVTNYLGQIMSESMTATLGQDLAGGKQVISPTRSFAYNPDGQMTQQVNEMGGKTQYFYTNRRDHVLTTGSNSGNSRNSEFPLTSSVQIADTRGPAGTFINSRSTYAITPDDFGLTPSFNQPLTMTDPRGAVTTYAYDVKGRVTTITKPVVTLPLTSPMCRKSSPTTPMAGCSQKRIRVGSSPATSMAPRIPRRSGTSHLPPGIRVV
jgi:YD repeat-containing protein